MRYGPVTETPVLIAGTPGPMPKAYAPMSATRRRRGPRGRPGRLGRRARARGGVADGRARRWGVSGLGQPFVDSGEPLARRLGQRAGVAGPLGERRPYHDEAVNPVLRPNPAAYAGRAEPHLVER